MAIDVYAVTSQKVIPLEEIMLASSIIEIIERRHARFQEQYRSRSAEHSSDADFANPRIIIEEYDALMAEIEGLGTARSSPHSPVPVVLEYPDDPSEEWILGDQGQSGG